MSSKKADPKKKQALSHERVVHEALAVTNAVGLDALTMRGLAQRLGVEPMSLYHWFPSRDHLLDALLDEFLVGVGAPASGDFRERLSAASRLLRAACQKNPGLVPFMVVHRFNTERALGVLDGWLGLFASVYPQPAARAAAFRTWIHWIVGFVLDEAAGYAKGPSAQAPPTAEEVTKRFAFVAALGPYNRPEHFDALFDSALALLLEMLAAPRRSPPRSPRRKAGGRSEPLAPGKARGAATAPAEPRVRSRGASRERAPGSPGSRGSSRRTGKG